MSVDRLRAEVPPVVTAVVGIVVAVVSGVFGISAHGLAAGAAAGAPTPGQILTVAAASAGVGALTAALSRRGAPVLTAAAGLVAGQGLVHLVLAAGHAQPGHLHTGTAHAGQVATPASAGPLGHHATDPAAVRAAMDGQGLADGLGLAGAHSADLMTPEMLAAHLAAIVLTLTLVAVLTGALSWVAARVMTMAETAHLVVVAALLTSYHADTPRRRFLVSRGGTRAPPVYV